MSSAAQPWLQIDETHDPALTSWVAAANDPATEFPVQNLPFGRFRTATNPAPRLGVAIGDQVLDLERAGLVEPGSDLNALMARGPALRRTLRLTLSRGLRAGSPKQADWAAALMPMAEAELLLPCRVGDYTDFYIGIPRHPRRASVPAGQPAAAELQMGADRLPRPRVLADRQRPGLPAPERPVDAARRDRTPLRPLPAPGP